MTQANFRLRDGRTLPYPIFFPDATRGYVKALKWGDVAGVGVEGVLVNTLHILLEKGREQVQKAGGIAPLMGWGGAVISDSGGFQVMSLIKRGGGRVSDEGARFMLNGQEQLLTPEESIKFQLTMGTDLMVVLDDFTPPSASYEVARETVERTTAWAKRSKQAYLDECERLEIPHSKRPYLIGVVQGGEYRDLRRQSAEELIELGFDGYGWGGYPMREGRFDREMAFELAAMLPKEALLYGLGIGKPRDIVTCVRAGWQIFDCVIPTREARHGQLYFWRERGRVTGDDFYLTTTLSQAPQEPQCDCLACRQYAWREVLLMMRAREPLAYRLASIHNLRFYMELMASLETVIE